MSFEQEQPWGLMTVDGATEKTGWACWAYYPKTESIQLGDSGTFVAESDDWMERVNQTAEFLGRLANGGRACIRCVLLEMPQVFQSAHGEGANNSSAVLKLAWADATYLERIRHNVNNGCVFHTVPIPKWKGNSPKEITLRRVQRAWGVTPVDDNEADAIGIGDWFFRKGGAQFLGVQLPTATRVRGRRAIR